MAEKIAAVIGASGFVGRTMVEQLANLGYRIRAACRRPNEALFLKPLGFTGQIEPLYADITKPETLEEILKDTAVVINCVGILYEGSGSRKFQKVQAEAPGILGKLAKKAGVETLIHISAIGANASSPSRYARSKAQGEKNLKRTFPKAVIFRPSIIFGPDDNFFNAFARMAKLPLPTLTIIGAKTRFQPVYVEDLGQAAMEVVKSPKKYQGKIFELGGPRTFTFRELISYILKTIRKKRKIVNLPFPIASFIGLGFQILGRVLPLAPPITLDQVRLLKKDNVVSGKHKGFEAFGIEPTPIEAIVPVYLKVFRSD